MNIKRFVLIKYICLFFYLGIETAFSAAATQNPEVDLSRAGLFRSLLRKAEDLRDHATDTCPSKFEEETRSIASLLQKNLFPYERENLRHTFYWLAKTRHKYQGMPGLVSHYLEGWSKAQVDLLAVVDNLFTMSFKDPSFTFRNTPELIEEITVDLRKSEPTLKITSEFIKRVLREQEDLLKEALQISGIFAPNITIETYFTDLLVGDFHGWFVSAGESIYWPDSGLDDPHSDRAHVLPLLQRPENMKAKMYPLWSHGKRVNDKIVVKYYFVPDFIEVRTPLVFSLSKEMKEITPFVQSFLNGMEAQDTGVFPQVIRDWASLKLRVEIAPILGAPILGVGISPERRRAELKRISDTGFAVAQFHYGLMLYKGEGGARDLVGARTYYERAAAQGYATAQYNYGLMLYKGEGGARDLVGAREYFRRAADQGFAASQNDYGSMLYRGEGGPLDLEGARTYYERAAAQGYATAQYNYGLMLYKGEGGARDLVGARTYYERAAAQGYATAQYNYGWMLQNGLGGAEDLVRAREYYRLAADQRYAAAQNSYGWMLQNGLGGAEDLEGARTYYERAAAQGYGEAASRLHAIGHDSNSSAKRSRKR